MFRAKIESAFKILRKMSSKVGRKMRFFSRAKRRKLRVLGRLTLSSRSWRGRKHSSFVLVRVKDENEFKNLRKKTASIKLELFCFFKS